MDSWHWSMEDHQQAHSFLLCEWHTVPYLASVLKYQHWRTLPVVELYRTYPIRYITFVREKTDGKEMERNKNCWNSDALEAPSTPEMNFLIKIQSHYSAVCSRPLYEIILSRPFSNEGKLHPYRRSSRPIPSTVVSLLASHTRARIPQRLNF